MSEIGRQFLTPILTGAEQGYGRGVWRSGKHYAPDSLFPDFGVSHKQPHQMSPDEFAEHPYAVFHSSHLPWNQVQNKDFGRTNPNFGEAIHFGTEQAAAERSMTTGNPSIHKTPSPPAYHHAFWYIPKPHEAYNQPSSDDEANESEWKDDYVDYDEDEGPEYHPKDYSEYYRNTSEDQGSISLAMRRPESLRSHSDFVRQAIEQGKGHEVHPETMRQYREGTLGVVRKVPISDIAEMWEKRPESYTQTEIDPQSVGKSWVVSRAGRYSRGPDIGNIRARMELDDKEGGGYRHIAGLD